jgi:UDP-N-acetylglucosamine--N-acetylmuramyl-(pentapeptide) pyrophosphoryl-undecaprenol N-acetylglucosamine transferase
VVSFGGFSAVGLGLAAFVRRQPIFLHEANLHMGKAVRCLAPLAQKVYLPPDLKEIPKYVHKQKYEAMGYPIRRDFCLKPISDARMALRIPIHGKHLVLCGGSQGARVLVEWTMAHEADLVAIGYHVTCLTGLGGIEREIAACGSQGLEYIIRYQQFSDHMDIIYGSADLAICRAGAGTIAELIHCHLPSILVPYPFAAGDHQTANGRALAGRKMAILLPQCDLPKLWPTVRGLTPNNLNQMRKKLKQFSIHTGDPAKILAANILANVRN